MVNSMIDSREGFQYDPTPEDWAEYEQWLEMTEFVRFESAVNEAFQIAAIEDAEMALAV